MNKELVTAALFEIVKVVLLFQKIRYVLLILGGGRACNKGWGALSRQMQWSGAAEIFCGERGNTDRARVTKA